MAGIAVTNFAVPSAEGEQSIAHGLGETPKALIFFSFGADADGTWRTNAISVAGFYDTVAQKSLVGDTADGDSSPTAARYMSSNRALVLSSDWDGSGVGRIVGEVVSLDSDSIEINWTTLVGDIASFTGRTCAVMAIGGGNVRAKLVSDTMKTSTGTQAKTGVGFKPDTVLFINAGDAAISENSVANDMYFGLGWMCADGTQAAISQASQHAGAASASGRQARTDSSIVICGFAGATRARAGFSAMDADGYTLNWGVAAATAAPFYALCLKGVRAKSLAKSVRTSTGSEAWTGAGFAPTAALMMSASIAVNTAGSGAVAAIGAASGTSAQYAGTEQDRDGLATTDANRYGNTVLLAVAGPGTNQLITKEASLTSFDADGHTLNYTTATAAAVDAFTLELAVITPITGPSLYPRTEDGEATTSQNDKLGNVAPSSGSDGTDNFSTSTTVRYILLKPGVLGTTTPNQTSSPAGIAAQGFGFDILISDLTDVSTGYPRSTPAGVWNFNQQIALSAGDAANNVYAVLINVYRRNTDGSYTFLFSAISANQAGGAGAATLTFAWSSTSQPNYNFAEGETIHVEYWIKGKGVAVTGQTITFNIGSADNIVVPNGGIFTLIHPYGAHQRFVGQAIPRAGSR